MVEGSLSFSVFLTLTMKNSLSWILRFIPLATIQPGLRGFYAVPACQAGKLLSFLHPVYSEIGLTYSLRQHRLKHVAPRLEPDWYWLLQKSVFLLRRLGSLVI